MPARKYLLGLGGDIPPTQTGPLQCIYLNNNTKTKICKKINTSVISNRIALYKNILLKE
jgi:hypothetical protein